MNSQILLSERKKKNILSLCSAEFPVQNITTLYYNGEDM